MKKKSAIYLLIMALFAVYLFSANSIVLAGEQKTVALQGGIASVEKQTVIAHLDYAYPLDDMLDRVYFSGWAFTNTEKNYSERAKGIVLVGENGDAYICTTNLSGGRPDAQNYAVSQGYKVNDADLGFGLSFSVMNLKNGRYRIGVYCRENDENYGLVLTSKQLVKANNKISITGWNASEATLQNAETVSSGAMAYVDTNTINDSGNATIQGWAFVPEQDSANSKTYLLLTYEDGVSVIYDTLKQNRTDIVAAFGSEMYANAGFTAEIPAELLRSEVYSVCVLLEDETGIYTSPEMLNAVKFGLGIEGAAPVKLHSEQRNLDSALNMEADAKTNVDVDQAENGRLVIKGWGFIPEEDPAAKSTYVLLTHKDGTAEIFDTVVQNRPDLADGFKNEMYANAGFSAEIPVELLYSDDYSVSVLIEDEAGLHTSEAMLDAVQSGLANQELVPVEEVVPAAEVAEITEEPAEEEGFSLTKIIAIPLTALMKFCHGVLNNYILSIVVFTLLSKLILLPISLWMQRNSIKMVEMMPDLNRLKIKYFGDKETISEETQILYKKKGYQPLLSSLPMIIQIVMLMGVIEAVKSLLGDSDSWLLLMPAEEGGVTLLMPLAAGFAAAMLCLAQNKIAPLQKEQPKAEKLSTAMVSISISLFLGAYVSLGTGVYWIASNLISIPMQMLCNVIVNPKKYVDYEALEDSRKKLAELEGIGKKKKESYFSENKKRERADYKRFFSVVNKHLVFYSESNGFYKYFKGFIEYILEHTNLTIHYITSDPNDKIFELEKTQPKIRGYYIGENKLITLMMKMDADMVVMTMPDLENYHIKRSYIRNDIEYIYVQHGMGSNNMCLRTGCVDHFDTVFCAGIHQKEEVEQTEQVYGLPGKTCVELGYPMIDDMRAEYAASEHKVNKRKKILIAPSWQKDNIIDSCLEQLLDSLKNTDHEIIVRPHPQEVRLKSEYMNALKQKYEPAGIEIQTDFSSNNPIMEADVLITDWSGISWEYAFTTRRPVLYINTPMRVMNPEYQKISTVPLNILLRDKLGKSLNLDQLDKTAETVDYLLAHKDAYYDQIEQLAHQYIYNLGSSAEVGGKYIIRRILKKVAEKKERSKAQR